MRATRCAFHRRIASPSAGELSGRLDDQRFTLSRQREAALLEDLFTRRPLDNCWQAHRVFTRLRGALPALARQGGDRQFGHGWGEGYERGRQAGASAQDAVAQKESAMRDGTIAALRSQLALALSQLFVITRFEEPSAETLQAVEFDALFAGRYPRGDRPTH